MGEEELIQLIIAAGLVGFVGISLYSYSALKQARKAIYYSRRKLEAVHEELMAERVNLQKIRGQVDLKVDEETLDLLISDKVKARKRRLTNSWRRTRKLA